MKNGKKLDKFATAILVMVVTLGVLMALAANARAQFQEFKLENPQWGYPTRELGHSISVDGDTMIAGAPVSHLNLQGKQEAGEAKVYRRDGLGVWQLEAELTASDAALSDRFGYAVSVSGDTAVVGAYYDDDGGYDSGSAYIFTRSGVVWTQQQKLTASDAAAYHYFGSSVFILGDTALIGAPGDDDMGVNSGSVYVFTRSGGVWTQQQKMIASDAEATD